MRTLSILWLGMLLTVAALGPAAAAPTLRQGVAAMARQDYAAAVVILSPLAQNGDPAAQAYMGYLYAIGRGVPPPRGGGVFGRARPHPRPAGKKRRPARKSLYGLSLRNWPRRAPGLHP